MTIEIANDLFGYFELLYDTNRNLIMCCGLNIGDNYGIYERLLQTIILNIPRMIPYAYCWKKDIYTIDSKDGLMEFSDQLPYLSDDYNRILHDNYDFLLDVKKIRNKLEHKVHGVSLSSSGRSTLSLFDMTYRIDEEEITLYAGQFIKCIKQLNILYTKLQNEVETFAYQNGKNNYAYYRRMTKYNFSNFNEIYDCPIVRKIGQALFPF